MTQTITLPMDITNSLRQHRAILIANAENELIRIFSIENEPLYLTENDLLNLVETHYATPKELFDSKCRVYFGEVLDKHFTVYSELSRSTIEKNSFYA